MQPQHYNKDGKQMRTVRIKPYQFSELSKAAKQEAIKEFADINVGYDWWDFVYEDAGNVGIKLTGFDIGRGRDISGEFKTSAEDAAESILKEHGETCESYKVAKKFLAAIGVLRVTIKLTGKEEDDYQDEAQELEDEFKKEILNCYWEDLRNEYEYKQTDEAIIETIECNEYEFEKDGTFHSRTRRKAS